MEPFRTLLRVLMRRRPKHWFEDKPVVDMMKGVARNDPARVKAAVARGADPNAVGREGMTPLALCLFYPKRMKGIRALLEAGADPNFFNEEGITVLGIAVQAKDNALLKLLVEHGGDPNLLVDGEPLTHMALMRRRHDTLWWLLEHGGDINGADTAGYTLLMTALTVKNKQAALGLLRRGAQADLAGKGACTTPVECFEEAYPDDDFLAQYPEVRDMWEMIREAMIEAGARFPSE